MNDIKLIRAIITSDCPYNFRSSENQRLVQVSFSNKLLILMNDDNELLMSIVQVKFVYSL